MVRLVCPACQSASYVADESHAAVCDSCGSALSVPQEETVIDAPVFALVDDLREAFRLDADDAGDLHVQSEVLVVGKRSLPHVKEKKELPPNSRVGDFRIIQEIGRGGMGIVYRANQESLGRDVALKVLPSYLRHGRTATQRFKVEAKAAARLNHTNVVPIYAQGEVDGNYYYAMKLIEGISLDTAIKTQPHLLSSTHMSKLSSTRVTDAGDKSTGDTAIDETHAHGRTIEDYQYIASLMVGVADGLAHAHAAGVIHRDIKPHNLILGEDRKLHIVDFGLARLEHDPHMTISGEVMGTPVYLSPEQASGDVGSIGEASDIYSAGVTLYELITDQRAFSGATRDQVLQAVCHTEPTRPRAIEPRIPVDLETICLRAMAKDIGGRYPSANAFAEDLRRFAEGRPILSRRVNLAERAVKWVRRHKAVSTALAAVLALALVSSAWITSAVKQRREEGARLLTDAYSQLAFHDFRRADETQPLLDRAIELGVDDGPLAAKVAALIDIGESRRPAAAERLQQLVDADAADTTALYLLAWAQRQQDREAAQQTFLAAEELGGPITPEGWFFRGMAVHYRDAEEALHSYRRAIDMRAENDQFYPLAELHWARAHNQILYRTRTLESFDQAELALRQLIEHKRYRAMPYYLLAIAYRLSAEIRLEEGDDLGAKVHFDEAIRVAREGQTVEPDNPSTYTSEATALERIGEYGAAIEARSAAIEVATDPHYKCENFHYRWRNHFLLGDLESARADVERHAECIPNDVFYAAIYPALLTATDEGVDTGRAILDEWVGEATPSPSSWLAIATGYRLLGDDESARALLSEQAQWADDESLSEWTRHIWAFAAGHIGLEQIEPLADRLSDSKRKKAELFYHAAMFAIARGERLEAINLLSEAHKTFAGELTFSYHAFTIHRIMDGDEDWPHWAAPNLPVHGRAAKTAE